MSTQVTVKLERAGWHCVGYPKFCKKLHRTSANADACVHRKARMPPQHVDFDLRIRTWLSTGSYSNTGRILDRTSVTIRNNIHRAARIAKGRLGMSNTSTHSNSLRELHELCEQYLKTQPPSAA